MDKTNQEQKLFTFGMQNGLNGLTVGSLPIVAAEICFPGSQFLAKACVVLPFFILSMLWLHKTTDDVIKKYCEKSGADAANQLGVEIIGRCGSTSLASGLALGLSAATVVNKHILQNTPLSMNEITLHIILISASVCLFNLYHTQKEAIGKRMWQIVCDLSVKEGQQAGALHTNQAKPSGIAPIKHLLIPDPNRTQPLSARGKNTRQPS